MKLKKYKITENKNAALNFQFIGRDMETSMINGLQKQGYHMPKRQFKTIGQTYKREDKTSI